MNNAPNNNNMNHYVLWGRSVYRAMRFLERGKVLPNSWGVFLDAISSYIPSYYLMALHFVDGRLKKPYEVPVTKALVNVERHPHIVEVRLRQ